MRIAQLAPLAESVPPKKYGGTELVVHQLTEQLVKRGHEVVLFASGDSTTSAELASTVPRGLREDGIFAHRWCAYEMASILELQRRRHEFDVIHNHLGYLAFPFLDHMSCAVLSTNHNPVGDYCAPIYLSYKHLPFVAISDAYQRLNYPDDLNYVGRVYNAVDVDAFIDADVNDSPRDYLLFLGRVSHAKGALESIEMARAIGMPLEIAGKIDETDRCYFEREIEPNLSETIQYVGEVDFDKKMKLYRGAKAVLYPINFDEPFGLVMVEALACGTPLLAVPRGSVREILEDGVTGFVSSSISELISKFGELEKIKSSDCVERARAFSITRMVDGYESIYRKLLDAKVSTASLVVSDENCINESTTAA